jgi:hypothetical protein
MGFVDILEAAGAGDDADGVVSIDFLTLHKPG